MSDAFKIYVMKSCASRNVGGEEKGEDRRERERREEHT
jgi:hypothetical protein